MCFSGEMSAVFSAMGLFSAYWVYKNTSNLELASGVFFFFSMEFLQMIQYFSGTNAETLGTMVNGKFVVDEKCNLTLNKVLTVLGFLHICCQPYYCHVINKSLTKSKAYREKYDVILRLCFMGGLLLFLRLPLSYLEKIVFPNPLALFTNAVPATITWDLYQMKGAQIAEQFTTFNSQQYYDHSAATEWLRGNHLCTFKSNAMWHLGWSIPMSDPSYFVMGAGIHSFLMFAPFLALYEKKGMIIQGCVLFFLGPVMASLVSNNIMEQASIWCFFSIAQIAIMLFVIREVLLREWGKNESLLFNSKVTPVVSPVAAKAASRSNSKGGKRR